MNLHYLSDKMDNPDGQIEEVRERLESYKKNPEQALDFDQTLDDIEKEL